MSTSALAITEEHRDLAAATVGQLRRVDSRASARAALTAPGTFPTDLWRAGADLGWNGLAIAEQFGGSGYGLAELAVVVEVTGGELMPGPFLPTVAAATVIDRCAPDSVRARLLPGLADGSTVAALGVNIRVNMQTDMTATAEWPAVLGAPDADVLVLSAGEDLLVVDARADGVTVTPLPTLDPTRSVGSVSMRGASIPADHVLRGASRRARTVLRILAAAEAVGVSWSTLHMAVEYAKVREQFGRAIGTFQAVKHHAADMLVAVEQTAAATWTAARCDALDEAALPAAVAAAHAIRAQVFNAQNNIQLHGGIGYTWEHDAHLYLRRARTMSALLADGNDPLAELVDATRTGLTDAVSVPVPPGRRTASLRGGRGRRTGSGATRERATPVPCRFRLPGAALATAVGSSRRCARTAGDRGGVPRYRPARPGNHRLGDADHRPGRHRRPTGPLGRAGAARRNAVVSTLLRTRCWIRCSRGAYVGQEGRRRVAGHRAEGVDKPCPALPMGTCDGPDRP